MKTYKYILVIMITAILSGCQKDPLSVVNDGAWNKERNILNISFAGQVGSTTITRDGNTATIEFLSYSDDFSAIAVNALEVSFGASASVSVGEKLNFNNPDHSATIKITPVNGEPLDWTIKVALYDNPYAGTWGVETFRFKWDDWFGWGLAGEDDVVAKMSTTAKGLDDAITFGAIEGVEPSGSLYGSYERAAGADGSFGSYISPLGTDFSYKFGQLPNGKGKYFINPDNTISVEIDGSGQKLTSKGSKTTDGQTMNYQLDSPQDWSIDWNDYYGSENQFKVAYEIWYILKKK